MVVTRLPLVPIPRRPNVRYPYACAHCGVTVRERAERGARGLCRACYSRLWRTGQFGYQYADIAACITCGRPRAELRDGQLTQGRCVACYGYRKRTGHERPEHLIKYAAALRRQKQAKRE